MARPSSTGAIPLAPPGSISTARTARISLLHPSTWWTRWKAPSPAIQNFSITFDYDKDEDIKNLKDSYQYLSNNEIEYYYELNRHELKSIPNKRDTLFIIDYINLNKILDNKNKELENESKQKALS